MNLSMKVKVILSILFVALGIFIATRAPAGVLTKEAVIYMGIFATTILLLLIEVVPLHITLLLHLVALVLFKVQTVDQAFSQFGTPTVWFVVGVFGFGAALANSGLLKRIALNILRIFPDSYNGTILAQLVAGAVISPMVPSLVAKASLMSPVAKSVNDQIGYPNGSKPGAGIFSATYISSAVFGNIFLTGSIFVPALLSLMKVKFSFVEFLGATWLWGLVIMVLAYFFIIRYFKPSQDEEAQTHRSPGFIKSKIAELGPMSSKEIIAAAVLVITLLLWIFEKKTGIHTTVVTLTAMSVLAIVGLLSTVEFGTKIMWPIVIFYGGLLTIANLLSTLKIGTWIASALGPMFGGVVGNIWIFVIFLCILTYALRYFVVSIFAVTVLLFAVFAPLAAAAGINQFVVGWVILMAAQVWSTSFNNTNFIAAQGASGGLVTWHTAVPMSYAYMVINIIACLLSVPLWMAMGWI